MDIDKKQDIIENSYAAFKEKLAAIESLIFSKVFDYVKGKDFDKKSLIQINRYLKKVINSNSFRSPLAAFLKNFDDVERLQKAIIGKEIGQDLSKFGLNTEKKLIIDEISEALLSDQMIKANLHNPLKQILYRYASTGIEIKTAEKELREYIIGNNFGHLQRYVKPLTVESLQRFDGAINQRIATDLKLDGFRIVGSNIKTSLPQCIEMTAGTGKLGEFEVNGKYSMDDLPKIIDLLQSNYNAVNKSLNVSNYFIYRNHWGCRHQFIPTRLTKKDKDDLAKRNESVSLDEEEKEISKLDYERFSIFDGEKIIARKDGERREVNVAEFVESRLAVGNVVTHNHPSVLDDEFKITSPLSTADIIVAFRLGAKQMRAVGGKNKWTMDIDEEIEIDDFKIKREAIESNPEALEHIIDFVMSTYKETKSIGIEKYNEFYFSKGLSEFQANRQALREHHLALFKAIELKIKGIKFNEIYED